LDPIDLSDAGDRRWARACLPPEIGALERFDAAVRVAQANPCTIHRADALDDLPADLDAVPDDVLPVVTDTYTAVFFTDDQRLRMRELLRDRGASRDVPWISLAPLLPLRTPRPPTHHRPHL